MTRNILIVDRSVPPSGRWCEAFPDGRVVEAESRPTLMAGDIVWLPAGYPAWEALVAGIRAQQPDCGVVVLSSSPTTEEALTALEAGARGYCHSFAVPTLLREIAQVVAIGGLWVGPELLSRFVGAIRRQLPDSSEPLESILSARELEVARAVAAGRSNKEVAAQLGITERTVKAHLGAVFEKLQVRDRLQLTLRLAGRVTSGVAD